jgi:hypothetical protein
MIRLRMSEVDERSHPHHARDGRFRSLGIVKPLTPQPQADEAKVSDEFHVA